jgi:sialate O-acetylesterase
VLQREQPLRIWGTAAPLQAVTVTFGELQVAGVADAAGDWTVQLPALSADATGRDLRIVNVASAVVHDVVVGDVWLCSGQSNMAMGLDGCGDRSAIANADDAGIRYRPYFEHFASKPQADLRERMPWRPISPHTAGACSAVAYWFAHRVRPVAGVPIGLLECTVGGTEIECWMPPAAFDEYPENAAAIRPLRAAIAQWQTELAASLPQLEQWLKGARAAVEAGRTIEPPPRLRGHPNEDRTQWLRTTSLWNGMVHPLLSFSLRGVLWYQGENNGHEDHAYADKLRAMVAQWRLAWGRELPFYYVQLPGFGAPTDDPDGGNLGFAPCRMGQLRCARLPGFGMAVAIDCGDAIDIHPKDKRTVGERLARWALRNEYQLQVEPSGPLFRSVARVGATLRVSFDHVGAGLRVGELGKAKARKAAVATPEPLRGFVIAGADRRWVHATAHLDGADVVVQAAGVPEPVAVRYAYSAGPVGQNLWNRDGLPAAPFRSDDW